MHRGRGIVEDRWEIKDRGDAEDQRQGGGER